MTGQTIFFCPVVLQLSWPFSFLHDSHVWHFGESTIASHSQDPIVRILLNVRTLGFFTQPLHDSHLNTGYLIAEIQANLARNKANTWLNKFNLTSSNTSCSLVSQYILQSFTKKSSKSKATSPDTITFLLLSLCLHYHLHCVLSISIHVGDC